MVNYSIKLTRWVHCLFALWGTSHNWWSISRKQKSFNNYFTPKEHSLRTTSPVNTAHLLCNLKNAFILLSSINSNNSESFSIYTLYRVIWNWCVLTQSSSGVSKTWVHREYHQATCCHENHTSKRTRLKRLQCNVLSRENISICLGSRQRWG